MVEVQTFTQLRAQGFRLNPPAVQSSGWPGPPAA